MLVPGETWRVQFLDGSRIKTCQVQLLDAISGIETLPGATFRCKLWRVQFLDGSRVETRQVQLLDAISGIETLPGATFRCKLCQVQLLDANSGGCNL